MKSKAHYCRKIPNERKDITLDYYLISEKARSGLETHVEYGVEVIQTSNADGKSLSEAKEINNIFYTKDDALKFIKLISDNTVMPVGLEDVAEDYIIDYI